MCQVIVRRKIKGYSKMFDWMGKNDEKRKRKYHLHNKVIQIKGNIRELRGFREGMKVAPEDREQKFEESLAKIREYNAELYTIRQELTELYREGKL